ncbi:MAG: hypothetical protein HOE69_08055 [Euryarchaeota archaeon]|mgnify:FL=1|jgi:hypothetical protein|nr:hypothetical protein [Euryarchaeota archaeon]
MTESDPAEGEKPMPGVQLEGQRKYPTSIEKMVTVCCIIASLLLIGPALSADLSIPSIIQTPLAFCGLPLAGFITARLLTIPIHASATS